MDAIMSVQMVNNNYIANYRQPFELVERELDLMKQVYLFTVFTRVLKTIFTM